MTTARHTLAARRCALALAAAACTSAALALPPLPPGGADTPLDVTVGGTLVFRGCEPTTSDVTVRVTKPARVGRPGQAVRQADGSIRMKYSIVVGKENDATLPAQFTLTPRVDPAVCGTAAFAPVSRTAAQYASNANFDLQARNPQAHFIPMDFFLLFANAFLSNVRLHLDNDGDLGSSITIGGVTSGFDIEPEVRDLPFPLPGSGIFRIRDMNLASAQIARSATAGLELHMGFESNGIEVKGYHSTLGDLAMPDFQMSDIDLAITGGLMVRHGKLTVGFTNPRLSAGIASTGACNVFGIDWCNYLFGAAGSLRRKFETEAFTQLNGPTIQAALMQSLSDALAAQGITGVVGSVAVQNDLIVVTTIQ